KYTYQSWYQLIRELAPQAVIFGKGPDVRWCGNEGGGTRQAEWSVIPISKPLNEFDWPDMTDGDLGSLGKLKENLDKGGYLHWYPAETNTSIRHGWFWRDENQHVKPASEILDIWYRSVGGNSVFLLNIPPNRDGLFAERDCKVLQQVGDHLREAFKTDLAEGATAQASATRAPGFEPEKALDANPDTCWMSPDWTPQAELTISLPKPQTFNRIVLQENIRHFGQRIAQFAIDAQTDGNWKQIATGQTVGYKKICRTQTTTTSKLRIRISTSRVCPTISTFALYHAKEP
ncbi:MAG: alpha-L-fucosidase, partial [Sedimentisphaerales bacterium]|nr:alpha-L-fucosidase [Sedimentisphaerales bacterium]